MLRFFARFRRRPRDYSPRHAVAAPAAGPRRRVPPPPPPPPPAAGPTPATASQVLPERAPPSPPARSPQGYPTGDARVSFVLSDGSVAHPELDEETSSRMDYVVRALLDNEKVRRTT